MSKELSIKPKKQPYRWKKEGREYADRAYRLHTHYEPHGIVFSPFLDIKESDKRSYEQKMFKSLYIDDKKAWE